MFAALAAALLLQDSAAVFLKKVEDKYAEAKSFSVIAEATGKGPASARPTEGQMKGFLKSKGEGKLYIEFSGKLGASEIPKIATVSDGARLQCTVAAEVKTQPHAQPMGTLGRVGFVRGGLFGAAGALVFWANNPKGTIGKLFEVTKAADAGTERVGDRACRIVSYTLSSDLEKLRTTQCKIWVDSEKLVILKRELVNETGTIVETYSESTFDAEIADEQFKIP